MMFNWTEALFAFFVIMGLFMIAWMIASIVIWIEDRIGYPYGLLSVFVIVGIMFALIVGVSAV